MNTNVMLNNLVSRYETYCISRTAHSSTESRYPGFAVSRVRRAHHGAHGAPYITQFCPTAGLGYKHV